MQALADKISSGFCVWTTQIINFTFRIFTKTINFVSLFAEKCCRYKIKH